MTRKHGGQPGNTNALKHGFYSRSFRATETADLLSVETNNLDDEIRMLKVVARRVLESAETESPDYEDMLKTLAVLGATSTRIAALMRTKKILAGEDTTTTAAISAALSEVIKELNIK
jgi:two-component sensor histidine kinase